MANAMNDESVRVRLGVSKGAIARWARVTIESVNHHERGIVGNPSRARLEIVYAALRVLDVAFSTSETAYMLDELDTLRARASGALDGAGFAPPTMARVRSPKSPPSPAPAPKGGAK